MSEETARRYGEAGRPLAEAITWDAAIAPPARLSYRRCSQ